MSPSLHTRKLKLKESQRYLKQGAVLGLELRSLCRLLVHIRAWAVFELHADQTQPDATRPSLLALSCCWQAKGWDGIWVSLVYLRTSLLAFYISPTSKGQVVKVFPQASGPLHEDLGSYFLHWAAYPSLNLCCLHLFLLAPFLFSRGAGSISSFMTVLTSFYKLVPY